MKNELDSKRKAMDSSVKDFKQKLQNSLQETKNNNKLGAKNEPRKQQ